MTQMYRSPTHSESHKLDHVHRSKPTAVKWDLLVTGNHQETDRTLSDSALKKPPKLWGIE